MCKDRFGFTLIEVLLVVVILAVLAGMTVTRFLNVADDAKQSTLKHNLAVLETQLELYRAQHLNSYPKIVDNSLPQLTSATNAKGEIGPAGPDYPFGPYLIEPPMNPYDGSKAVVSVEYPGERPTGVVGSLGGWQYDETTGKVWPNNPEYYK